MENHKPPENTSPFRKNSITPPDKIFSLPPPNEIVISLKKLEPPPEKTQQYAYIITPSLKNLLRKIFLVP